MEDYKKYFDMPLAFEPRSLKPSAPDVSKQSLDPVDCWNLIKNETRKIPGGVKRIRARQLRVKRRDSDTESYTNPFEFDQKLTRIQEQLKNIDKISSQISISNCKLQDEHKEMLEKLELLTKLKPGLECNFQITQGLSKRSIFQSFIEENELLVQRDQDLRLSMTSRTENKVRSPKLVRQIHKETSKNILDIRDLPTNSCKKCDLVWIGESKSSCDLCKEKYPGIGIDIEIINNKRPRPPSKKIERYPTPKVDGEFKRTISPARIISPFPTEALNEIILKINGKEYTLKSNKFSLIMPKPNDALITENSCDLSFSDLLKQINTSVMREDRPLSIDVHSGSTTFKAPITPSFQNKKTEMIFGSTGGSDDILTEEAQTVPTEISFSESKSEIFSENPQANLLQKLKNYGTDAQADLNLLIHKQNYLSKKPQNFSECRDNTETLLNKHLEIFKKILPGVMEMIPEYGNIIERSIKSIVLLIDHIFVSYSVRLQKLSQETNHKQIENNVKQIENKYLSRISALTHLIQRYEEVILQCKRALRKDERNNGILLMIEDLGY